MLAYRVHLSGRALTCGWLRHWCPLPFLSPGCRSVHLSSNLRGCGLHSGHEVPALWSPAQHWVQAVILFCRYFAHVGSPVHAPSLCRQLFAICIWSECTCFCTALSSALVCVYWNLHMHDLSWSAYLCHHVHAPGKTPGNAGSRGCL